MGNRISRRKFLEKGSKGVAAAVVLPYFLKSNLGEAFGMNHTDNPKLNDYLKHFGVDESTIQQVLAQALSKGGDYADLYFEHNILNYIGLEDNDVNRAYTNISFGVGIRVLKGDQTGYSYTEEITPKAMKLAALTAAEIAGSGKSIEPQKLKFHNTPDYYPIDTPWEDVGIKTKIPILQSLNDKVFSLDSRIIKNRVTFNNESSYVLLATSEGKMIGDYRPMALVINSCTAEQNGQREQHYASIAERNDIDIFTEENLDRLANDSVSKTVQLFEAVKPQGGEMPVLLAAGSSGILLHEAIGHGMEADFNRKDISIFSDKIDKPVAESFINIIDDGTNPHMRGTINVDDEGNDSQKTFLVENGILRSYLHDKISAKHYGIAPTGNGRRESFRHKPLPRMRNTYMTNGPHTRDEIIESTKNGIIAEDFTNGQVFIGAGDFTFYVKSGYLIEDGKITAPIKDINIIGNGPQVLKDIVMAADDMKMDKGTWTCGKGGQSVPVSMGLPTVKVSKITVGGQS